MAESSFYVIKSAVIPLIAGSARINVGFIYGYCGACRSPESFFCLEVQAVRPEINLPSTFEDLSRFVLVGREKLVAVRAEIRAIDKVGLAKEVREQKLQEAQFISEAVLDASVRIGELMQAVPKATTNHKKKDLENDSGVDFLKPKSEVIKEAGFTPKQIERFQQMAANPELVEQVKAEAKENGDIASQSAVMEKIKEKKQAEKKQERKADIERQGASQDS